MIKRPGEADVWPYSIHLSNRREGKMDEASKSYRERQKETRAAARAKREAEKAAWHRRIELMVECRRMALDLTQGQKISKYTLAQLRMRAEEMIGLVAKARAKIAERNSKLSCNSKRPVAQGLPMLKTHAQNGAAQ
jgi:hypothetical protein